jgi:hypothetical protein
MQPESPAQQKLAQLPLPALEALLDSPELQAASENSVIAAVSYWLEQHGRAQELTKEQKQRLAFKLRLSRATPWYLLRVVMTKGHWLHDILSTEQKLLLTAATHSPADWGLLQSNSTEEITASCLCGMSSDLEAISWWEEKRPVSSITKAELIVEISLRQLWEERSVETPNLSQACFFNGIVWSMNAEMDQLEGEGFTLGAYIWNNRYKGGAGTVAFTSDLKVVGVARGDTEGTPLEHAVLWGNTWGCNKLRPRTIFTSLEDATAKLAPFIHPDGKLHIKGTITKVS